MPNDIEYILNEKNKYINKKYIKGVLKKHGNLDIEIKHLEYFQKAMIHLSYLERNEKFYANNKTKAYQIQSTEIQPINPEDIPNTIPLQQESYERLEFLGDAVLHNILAEYLFKRYDKEDEGFMTKLRTKIENGDTLSILSEKIGLGEYIVISRYVEMNGGRVTNRSILEDAFEAFIGALYLDAGYDVCKQFVDDLIEKEIDLAQMLYTVTNFKEKVLQYFHLKRWQDPVYGTLDISGHENAKQFTMYLLCRKTPQDEGEIVATGISSSKKGAEQECCKKYLMSIGNYKEDEDDSYEEPEEISDEEYYECKKDKVQSEEEIEEISDEVQFECPSCKALFCDKDKYLEHIDGKVCVKKSVKNKGGKKGGKKNVV